MSRLTRDGNPSRETKLSDTCGDRGMSIFPVQLTTSRIGNLTRLIHTLRYVITIHIHIYSNISIIFYYKTSIDIDKNQPKRTS